MSKKLTTEFLDEHISDGMDDIAAIWYGEGDLELKETLITENCYQMYDFIDEKGYDTCDTDNKAIIYSWAKNFLLTNEQIQPADVGIVIGFIEKANNCE